MSHVFGGNYHFSSEQAERVAKYFRFTADESEYFILLVSFNRAGTDELREFYKRLLNKITERHLALKKRIGIEHAVDAESQTRYYSDWTYAAIQSIVAIPKYRSVETIAARLNLSLDQVAETLAFLLQTGTIKRERGEYVPTETFFHLDKNTPLIAQHHRNWRLKTMTQSSYSQADRLHYSGVVTCSREVYSKVQHLLTDAFTSVSAEFKETKDEEIAVLCLDWYSI